MIITRVYSTPDGESHAEDLEVPMDESGRSMLSPMIDVKGAILRESTHDGATGFHNARMRHLCVPLQGGFELECTDGTKKRIVPGTIMLGEDMTGRGHASVEIPPRLTMLLPLPEDFDTSTWKRVG